MAKKGILKLFSMVTAVVVISLFNNTTSFASSINTERKAYIQEEQQIEGIIEANLETGEIKEKSYEEILSSIPTSYTDTESNHVEACPPADVASPYVIIGDDNRRKDYNPAICAIEITWNDNCKSAGTAFMIGPDTAVTAGHCVYEYHSHSGHPAHNLAKSIKVIPGRKNQNDMPYGYAYATNVVYETTWKSSGDFAEDWGLIKLNKTMTCGSLGFAYSNGYDGWVNRYVTVTGYPKPQDYNWQMYSHREQVKRAQYKYMLYAVDTEGGQSGAPVTEDGTGFAIGIHHGGDDIEHTGYNLGVNITKERYNTFLSYR